MNYSELKDKLPNIQDQYEQVDFGNNINIQVKKYLPIEEKADLIDMVVSNTLDENTGCFSPVRVNVYFSIAILNKYCNISFEGENIIEAYDTLESNGIINTIMSAIPKEELDYMQSLMNDTIADISRYNSSAAGIIHSMSGDADNLNESLQDILSKIKNKEGIELLGEIKNVVGND